MRVSCLVVNLEKAIPLLNKIVPLRAQIPILSNVLLEANDKGFFISATDLELGVKIHISAKIEEKGAVTIPGKQFFEVINSIPKDKATILQEKDTVTVVSGENKILFQTIPHEEFPHFFDKKGEKAFSFSEKQFKSILADCLYAVSSDSARPQLTGILVEQEKDRTNFIATDGFRLSVKKTEGKLLKDDKVKMNISSRFLNEALSLKTEQDETLDIYIFSEGSQVMIETKAALLLGKLIEGEFPNYERVIPSSFTTKIIVSKEDFIQAVKLSSIFARESANVIKLGVKNDTIQFFAKSQGIGEGEIKIDGRKTGDDLEISFNAKYLLDFLKNAEGNNIIIELNSGQEPAKFTIEGDDSFLHIIMPVRVQE